LQREFLPVQGALQNRPSSCLPKTIWRVEATTAFEDDSDDEKQSWSDRVDVIKEEDLRFVVDLEICVREWPAQVPLQASKQPGQHEDSSSNVEGKASRFAWKTMVFSFATLTEDALFHSV
jgi:hypothetical protein